VHGVDILDKFGK
jgi:hypothetical protein